MHILMLSDVYFPRINGVSTSIETFRRDLGDLNINVSLIAPEYSTADKTPATWRVPSRKVLFDPEDRLMHWGHLMRAVKHAASSNVDMVHIQTPFLAHYAGIRAGRIFGVPMVATYHTHFEEYIHHYLPLLPRPALRLLARRLARNQCNDLDAVVVPSEAMRQTLNDYGVTAPLHILPTGIPIERFSGGDGRLFRECHAIAPDRPLALYVGRIAHEKNIGFLIDAADKVRHQRPDFLLLIAGEGPALASLRRRVEKLGLDDNVRFVGYLDRETELPDCYAAANVFVFSSKTETQGLVLLEAMAAGIPVYAFAAMGTRDIVESLRGAVVAPQEPDAFAAGLVELLADPQRLRQLSAQAREFANAWSAPERARQLAELYRSLVD